MPLCGSRLGLDNQLCEPERGIFLSEAPTDTLAQLEADILATDPQAVTNSLDDKAEEFLVACVKFAKAMQLNDDPWLGIRCLVEGLAWVKESHERMNKDVAVRRKPTSTMEAFRR